MGKTAFRYAQKKLKEDTGCRVFCGHFHKSGLIIRKELFNKNQRGFLVLDEYYVTRGEAKRDLINYIEIFLRQQQGVTNERQPQNDLRSDAG